MPDLSLDTLTAAFANGDAASYVILGLIFATVSMAVVAVAGLTGSNPAARRLRRQGRTPQESDVSVSLDRPRSPLLKVPEPLQKRIEPQNLEARTKVRLLLLRAGYIAPSAVSSYYMVRLLLAIALPLVFMFTLPLVTRIAQPGVLLLVAAGLSLAGWFLPWAYVNIRAKDRSQAIRRSFPDALDLLLICVEAGLGLDQAITRVGDEIATAHPELAEQFRLASLELRAGRSREDALQNLGLRSGVDEVSAFATLLIQSNELGTSLGQTLRVYADDMRNVRLMKAEEKAAQIPVKLSIPLVLFMLPAFMGTIMLPVIIRVVRVLLPTGAG